MKKLILLLAAVSILLIGIIIIIFLKLPNNQTTVASVTSEQNYASQKYQPQIDSQASVNVEVTPKTLGTSEENNSFTINFNTHSVDLDYDFTKITSLTDNLGNTYQALEWTGNRGGHHISGDIIFPRINKQATSIKLQISNINGIDRSFIWKL